MKRTNKTRHPCDDTLVQFIQDVKTDKLLPRKEIRAVEMYNRECGRELNYSLKFDFTNKGA